MVERVVYSDGGSGIPLAWNDPTLPDEAAVEWWYDYQSGRRLRVTRYTTAQEVVEELGEPIRVVTGPRGGFKKAEFSPKDERYPPTVLLDRRIGLELVEMGYKREVER